MRLPENRYPFEIEQSLPNDQVRGRGWAEIDLYTLLENLLGSEGKRRIMLRRMSNDELFRLYDSDLLLRLHNAKNLSDTRKTLERFKDYLGQFPPSPELAKAFLAQYVDRKPRTLYRLSLIHI